MKKLFLTVCAFIISGSFIGSVAVAAPYTGTHPLQTDTFSMGVGVFFSDLDGEVWADPERTDGDLAIDLQDDLGLDDSDELPALAFTWRISERQRFQFEYFEIGSDGSGKVERNIEWDDLEFLAGVKLKGGMEMDIGRGFYGYSFLKDEKKEFGAGLGLHYLGAELYIEGEALKDGQSVASAKADIDDWYILPNLGLFGNYAFSEKWLALGRVDWISADLYDYDGTLWNVEAALQYQAFKNFGVGLAYRYLSLDLEYSGDKKSDWAFDLDYSGPLVFFTANF